MFTVQSKVFVRGMHGSDVTDFLERCDDAEYQRWWPGTHLRFHAVRRTPGKIGSVFFMDEMIGDHHTVMEGVLTELVRGRRMVCQMKKGVRLPAHLVIELEDTADGVHITHTFRAGFEGIGRVLDPLIRAHLGKNFERAMDEHVKTEFPRLAELLELERAVPKRSA